MAATNSDAPHLDTYQAVVSAYSDFLTVAIHTILYERQVYPQSSFLKARKYNYPVRQSRHPRVCKWIQDAVAAVEAEMLKVYLFLFVQYHVLNVMVLKLGCSAFGSSSNVFKVKHVCSVLLLLSQVCFAKMWRVLKRKRVHIPFLLLLLLL